MRKKIIALVFTGVLLLALAALPVAAQENTGGVRGVVKDATGAVIPGADVTLTGLGIELTTSSDGTGFFIFRNLSPGAYTVKVTSTGFKAITISGVGVVVGQTTPVEANMEVGDVADTVEVTASAVIIDTQSSKSIVNVTEDLMDALPHGRGYMSMIELAPGARFEPLQTGGRAAKGFQIDGASSAENTFAIEGQDNTHIQTGQAALDPPTDFFQEVQVKSSGFEAEHGGALGGVINATAKKGGDAWHGAGVFYYRNDDLDAAPRGFIRQNPIVGFNSTGPRQDRTTEIMDPKEDDIRILEPGFEFGGPIFGEKLQFYGGYIPRLTTNERIVDMTFSDPELAGAFNGPFRFTRNDNIHFANARLDSSPQANTNLHASWNYAYRRTRGIDRPDADGLDGEFNGGAGTVRRADRGDVTPNKSYNLGGDWTNSAGWLTVSGRLGLWSTDTQNRGLPTGVRRNIISGTADANGAVLQIESPPGSGTFVDITGLDGTAYTTRVGTGSSNIGNNFQTIRDEFERRSVGVDAAFFFNAGGTHSVKVGYGRNELSNSVNRGYNIARVDVFFDDFVTPSTSVQVANCALVEATSLDGTCRGNFGYYYVRDTKTFGNPTSENLTFYVQDSWNINGRLTINAGVRFDNEFLPSFATGPNIVSKPIEFSFGDKFAPRLGASFDVYGDGKMKVFGSYGLFFDIMKFELPRGSFGGDYWHNCVFTLDTQDLSLLAPLQDAGGFTCNNGTTGSTPGTFIGEEDFRIPSNIVGNIDNIIDPNLKPMEQNEFTVGWEYQLTNDIGLEFRYARKRLERTVEDAGIRTAAGEEFFIVNPGEGIGFAPLRTDCATCGTLPAQPKPKREYDGYEFRLNKRFTNNWFASASYTYSKLFGNYSGLTSTDEGGRSSPNVNRFFDEQPMSFDQNGQPVFGNLPTDRPHTAKLFGGYRLDWAGMATTISTSQLVYSGTPISTTFPFSFAAPIFPWGRGTLANLSRDPATGNIILNSLERGARTPGFTQTDLNLKHEFKLSSNNEALRLQLEFNVLNAFNEKNAVGFHGEGTSGSLRTIGQFVQFNTLDPTSSSGVDYAAFFNGFNMIQEINNAGFTLDSRVDGGAAPELFQAPRAFRIRVAVVF